MDKDLIALNQLIDETIEKENELEKQSEELSLQSKAFATFIEQQKRHQAELDVMWSAVKEYMLEHNITEHETDFIKLKLSESGRYKTDDIDKVCDEVCEIKKTLSNKKVKAWKEVHGELPEGVELSGYILRKTIKEV